MSDDDFISLKKLGERASMSEPVLRRLINSGKLPHYRPGRKILVRWCDFVAFMETQRREINGDPELKQFLEELVGERKG